MTGARPDPGAPILALGRNLVVSIRDDLDDQAIVDLQDRLTEEIARRNAEAVIIDVSRLDIVDTFAGRMLGALARMSRILDARTVVVGVQPAVAMTLVELGMTLDEVETALNLDRALEMLAAPVKR